MTLAPRRPGTRLWTARAWFALATVCATGCARVELVTESAPMRVGPDSQLQVYTLQDDGEWKLSPNRVQVPEGWYLVPPSYVEEP